jgi:hypothetical protein
VWQWCRVREEKEENMANVRRWYGEGEIPEEDLDKPVVEEKKPEPAPAEKKPPEEKPAGIPSTLTEGTTAQ